MKTNENSVAEIEQQGFLYVGNSLKWGQRLDKTCLWTGALIPVGIVIGNAGYEILLNTTVICWLVRCILVRDNSIQKILKHPFTVPWACWLGVILFSTIWNGPGSKGMMHDLLFVRFVLFGLALIEISRRHPVAKYLVAGLMAGVAFAALSMILSYIIGFDFFGRSILRYTQKVNEASRIAPMAAFAAPFFWGLLTDGKDSSKHEKIAHAITFIVSIMLLFETQIRTALIGALIGILFSLSRTILKRYILSIVLAVSITGVFIFYFNRENLIDLSSFYDRIYYWKIAFAVWLENPVIGVGVSSFREAYQQIAESGIVAPFEAPNGIIYQENSVTHSHNIFFMLLACTGILGLAAFLWLFYKATVQLWVSDSRYRAGLLTWPIVFFSIGVTGWNIFGSWYQCLFSFFMVLIGSEYAKSYFES